MVQVALTWLGYILGEDDDSGFDVVWCWWYLSHLNSEDSVAFLKWSTAALRGLIIVKGNLCPPLGF